jgi:ADP-ribose pyrophosphatase
MEEGARTRWLPLDEAIAACMKGELSDLKTELGLRRLAERLASR